MYCRTICEASLSLHMCMLWSLTFTHQQLQLNFQIEIMGLPPHTTHLLQPLDVGIFNHVKKCYNEICISSGMRNSKVTITKSFFPIIWKNAIEQGATPSIIKSAFRRSGLHPFDPCAIDASHIKKRPYVCL